jgi:HlyD family secretion protein
MRIRFFAPVALFLLAAACKEPVKPVVFQAMPVEKRSIIVSARASGTVQPDTVVEVKSKASGEILDMKAETGQMVQRGTLLVRVDQRTPRNRLNQTTADLEVAKARFENAEAQRKRSDELFKTQSISTEEHETAVLAVANARAAVVGAQVAADNAKIAMEDTDVLAPINGTIISKSVERGQVISSPTSDVGGGTVLLKMADLNLVQVRTLVDETDIGKIRAGLRATVTVSAYPNQPFQGEVLKIEPLAETVQNVTMFAVQVRIDNRNGLLKPGMNADVEVHIGQRDNVLAVPNAALRTQRDVTSAATVLGISNELLQTMLADAQKRRDSLRATLAASMPKSDSMKADTVPKKPAGNTMTLQDGREITLPPGVTEKQITAIMAKFRSGERPNQEEMTLLRQVMGGGQGGGRGGFGGGGGRPPQNNNFQFGGDYIVFVRKNGDPTPVYVRTGLTDLDYSEIMSGISEADSVLVLPSASLVQQQAEAKNQINRMTGGGGLPGMGSGTTTGRPGGTTGGAAPAAGGAPTGGAARPPAGAARP